MNRIDSNEKKITDKILKSLNDWGLLIIAIFIVLLYTVVSSGINSETSMNEKVATNLLFIVINLISAFYIAKKVSMWGWMSDTIDNQKKIAKTAIRHNRASLASVLKLTKITNDKIEKVDDELTKQYIYEIKNHLETIYSGLRNSESDFKEIVNEELEEQNLLEIEISKLFEEITSKSKELEELSKNVIDKDSRIEELNKQVKEKQSELNTKLIKLPFGATSSGTRIGMTNPNFDYFGTIGSGTITLDGSLKTSSGIKTYNSDGGAQN